MKKNTVTMTLIITLAYLGCAPHIHLDFMGKEHIKEAILIRSQAKEKILVIDLNGAILVERHPGILNRDGDLLSGIYYRLRQAAEDQLVRGIILRIDSPGGDSTASDIIHHEILQFRRKTKIPVIALMMGVAASGGYYVACGCDKIIAHPTTITGSIGVIGILPGIKKLLDKVGIEVNIIKSGKMKDAGSPFKDLSKEEKSYFHNMITELYQNFLNVVYQSRKDLLSREEITEIADGRVYNARKALELKLIDQIGYFSDALETILNLASIPEADVIAYTYHPSRKTNIYANSALQTTPLSSGFKAFENLLPSLKSGFYYLWLPQVDD